MQYLTKTTNQYLNQLITKYPNLVITYGQVYPDSINAYGLNYVPDGESYESDNVYILSDCIYVTLDDLANDIKSISNFDEYLKKQIN